MANWSLLSSRLFGLGISDWRTSRGDRKRAKETLQFSLWRSRVVFTVGLGSAALSVLDPKGSERDLLASIARAGLDAVQKSATPTIERYVLALSMHVNLLGRSLREVTEPFVTVPIPDGREVLGYGFGAYRRDGFWVVDASTVVAEGLFAKIVRLFPPESELPTMAEALDHEEEALWSTLKLRFE